MQNKDLGLNKENVVTVYTNLWYNVNDFRQEILKNPNVQSVAMGSPIENLYENEEKKRGAKRNL